MSRLKLGMIGCGQIAMFHAERLVADGRAELAVLFDPFPAGAEAIRERFFPEARIVTELEEALKTPGLDGVIIATPTHLHYEQAFAALGAGLPILCEKPLAETREKIVHLIAEASKPGAPPLMVGYQRRFWSCFRTLHREIQSGRYGRVRAVSLHNTEHWLQLQALPNTWRNDPVQNPGGYLGDAGSHKIDAIFHLTGLEAVEVFAQVDYCGAEVPIRCTINGLLTGGVPLSMSFFGDAHQFREDLHIVLEEGDLTMRDREVRVARKNEVQRVGDPEPDSNATCGFVEMLEGKTGNPAPAGCALPVFDFTQGVLASAREGGVVRF